MTVTRYTVSLSDLEQLRLFAQQDGITALADLCTDAIGERFDWLRGDVEHTPTLDAACEALQQSYDECGKAFERALETCKELEAARGVA